MNSEADLQLLTCLAEHRVALVPQAARWLEVSDDAAARRVRRLTDRGLTTSDRVFCGGAGMVQITTAGLQLIESPLRAPGLRLDEYRHDVGVVWLWTAAREGRLGSVRAIEAERSMRSHDLRVDRLSDADRIAAGDPPLRGVGIGALGPGGRPQRHYPDLLLRGAGGREVAVELELTDKGPRRLTRIMDAYASDHRIAAVLYVVPEARLARQVTIAARAAGLESNVQVRLMDSPEVPGAPGPLQREVSALPARRAGTRQPAASRQPATSRPVSAPVARNHSPGGRFRGNGHALGRTPPAERER